MNDNIFAYWNRERHLEAMRRLQDENRRLYRRNQIGDAIVLITCLAVAVISIIQWAQS